MDKQARIEALAGVLVTCCGLVFAALMVALVVSL